MPKNFPPPDGFDSDDSSSSYRTAPDSFTDSIAYHPYPPAPEGYTLFINEPTDACYAVQTDIFDLESQRFHSTSRKHETFLWKSQQWVVDNSTGLKEIAASIAPFFLQSLGKALPGPAGSFTYMVGIGVAGVNGATTALPAIYDVLDKRKVQYAKIAGGLMICTGAALYAVGNDERLYAKTASFFQSMGAGMQGFGNATSLYGHRAGSSGDDSPYRKPTTSFPADHFPVENSRLPVPAPAHKSGVIRASVLSRNNLRS